MYSPGVNLSSSPVVLTSSTCEAVSEFGGGIYFIVCFSAWSLYPSFVFAVSLLATGVVAELQPTQYRTEWVGTALR